MDGLWIELNFWTTSNDEGIWKAHIISVQPNPAPISSGKHNSVEAKKFETDQRPQAEPQKRVAEESEDGGSV